MKKLYILILLNCFLFVNVGTSQVVFSGNGNAGFGSPIGNSMMSFSDDGTTITVNFTKGTGDFNDTLVMYIDNGSTGRTAINGDVNDTADSHRRAISNTGSGDITFPAGFEVTHSIAINTSFGGLWSIPNSGTIGDNGLVFIDAVGNPALASTASFSFSFDWSEIGLTNTDNFSFVVTYGNPNDNGTNMFSSDEGYGTVTPGNPGLNAFSFSTVLFYPSGTLGTNDFDNKKTFKISPNPVNTWFKINSGINELRVYDMTGKLVKTFNGNFTANDSFDISDLKQSIYLVKIENSNGQTLTSKLIKL